jgi:hypothetical protein
MWWLDVRIVIPTRKGLFLVDLGTLDAQISNFIEKKMY